MNFKIIGGGIAGLASAMAVVNSGNQATVFEKTKAFEPIGAGLQLGPNAARALQKLGAWEAVKPFTYAPPEIHMRDGRSGKLLKRLTLGKPFEARYGLPYLTAHRADLHRALLDVALSRPNIKIQTNTDVTEASTEGFVGIIAADGVWSKTRQKLFPGTNAITTTDTYFRSLLAMPKESTDISYDCVNLWMYPGGHVVHYPVGKPAQLNLIVITNGEEPKLFLKTANENLQGVINLPSQFTKWQSAYVAPLKHWHQGNVLLIGDAAHATLPYLAQGAAMALEDAVELQKQLRSNSSFTDVAKKLTQQRSARVTRLHKSSKRAQLIYHLQGTTASVRNLVLAQLPSAIFQSSLDWIYEYEN